MRKVIHMNAITIGGFGRSDQPQAMSSKEIADLTGKRHDHVLRDIRAYVGAVVQMERGIDVRSLDWGGSEGVQLFGETPIGGVTCRFEVNPQNGQSYPVYYLDKSATLTIVAGYNVLLRKRIIDRWQELESTQSVNPATLSRMQLIQLAMEAETEAQVEREKRVALEHKVEEDAPKTEFYDKFASADGLYGLQNAARVLNQPPNKFIGGLKAKYLFYQGGNLIPYRQYVERGLFEVKTDLIDDKPRSRTWVTPKGIQHFAKQLGAH